MFTLSKLIFLSSNYIQGTWALPQDSPAPIMCRARPNYNPLTASATVGSTVQTSAPASVPSTPPAPSAPSQPAPSAPSQPQQQSQPKQQAPAPAQPAQQAAVYNNDCLGIQNQARQAVNLAPMTWSSSLQGSATTYAKKLQSNNPSSLVLVHSGIPGVGENLYANSRGGTCVDAAKAWVGEKPLYPPGQPVGSGNFGAYGHYTQIITKRVTQIGCNPDLSAGFYVVCK